MLFRSDFTTVGEYDFVVVSSLAGCSEHRYHAAMKINEIECTFHHMGIPTTEPKPDERFSELFGMYTSDSPCKTLRIQWHRFDGNSSLHPLIRTVPHVALKVADLGGRPKSALVSEALRKQLAEVKPGDPRGRTYAELVADNMISIASEEAGSEAVHAAAMICDRIEGRVKQQIELGLAAEIRGKSDAELMFYLDNQRWPTEKELAREEEQARIKLPAEPKQLM